MSNANEMTEVGSFLSKGFVFTLMGRSLECWQNRGQSCTSSFYCEGGRIHRTLLKLTAIHNHNAHKPFDLKFIQKILRRTQEHSEWCSVPCTACLRSLPLLLNTDSPSSSFSVFLHIFKIFNRTNVTQRSFTSFYSVCLSYWPPRTRWRVRKLHLPAYFSGSWFGLVPTLSAQKLTRQHRD